MEGQKQPKRPTSEEVAEERLLDKHPARPEQVREGYGTGYDQERDTPDELREPNFARGLTETDPNVHGRFSTGEEELPEDLPEKQVERRFSEGIERSPTSE